MLVEGRVQRGPVGSVEALVTEWLWEAREERTRVAFEDPALAWGSLWGECVERGAWEAWGPEGCAG